MQLNFEPYDYQKVGIEFLKTKKYAMLADEMGLGKTIQSLVASKDFKHVLILCPAFLQNNWQNEINKVFKTPSSTILKTKKGRLDNYTGLEQYNILSYGKMKHLAPIFQNFDCVILDEAHYLRIDPTSKNITKKIYKFFTYFLQTWKPKALYMLSGTPVLNHVAESYYMFKFFSLLPTDDYKDCLQYYSNPQYFLSNFCYLRTTSAPWGMVTKVVGSRNEEELKQYLDQRFLRRVVEDVLDLPELIEDEIQVLETLKQDENLTKAWDMFNNEKIADIIITAKIESALNKVNATYTFAKEIVTDAGIVIFSEFRKPAQEIHSLLLDDGLSSVVITGEMPVEKREEYVRQFQDGKIKFLVCTIMSMNTGHTLTAGRYVIFNDLHWTPAQNTQALKRCHRIGSKKTVFVYYMLGSKIDRLITGTLRRKASMLAEVF